MTIETIFSIKQNWARAITLCALAFLLTLFCLELIKVSSQIASLWLPTALMTVIVFRLPAKSLPLLLSACLIGTVTANVLILGPLLNVLVFPLINLTQALLGGALLRMLLDAKSPLGSLLSWSKMVVATGIFTPLVGALLACWTLNLTSEASLRFFMTWTVSEIIGMLALGPIGLLWQPEELRKLLSQNVLFETLLTLVITLLLNYFALRYLPWSFTFVMVVLFYSAVRLPRFSAFIVFFATLSMMTLMLALNQLVRYAEIGRAHV